MAVGDAGVAVTVGRDGDGKIGVAGGHEKDRQGDRGRPLLRTSRRRGPRLANGLVRNRGQVPKDKETGDAFE